jgi:hypothetical protein
MKKIINLLTVVTISLTLYSCTKGGGSSSNNTVDTSYVVTIDTTTYFTATFLGKTLKNTAYKWTYAGTYVTSFDLSGSISTTNNGSTVTSDLGIYDISRSESFCQLDVWINGRKDGNALGNYKEYLNSYIKDLSISKQYDFDTSTIYTVTSQDINYFQGTYTGKLKDGTTKIPVTGTFKLKKK